MHIIREGKDPVGENVLQVAGVDTPAMHDFLDNNSRNPTVTVMLEMWYMTPVVKSGIGYS